MRALWLTVLLAASSASGHLPEGWEVAALQFPEGAAPEVDGQLGDWAQAGRATLTTEDFVDLVDEAPADAEDLDILVWIGWSPHTNRIYLAAQVRDDIHQVDRPEGTATTRIFQDDDLEIFVDGDHSGGQYADFSDLSQGEQLERNGAQASHFVLAGPHEDGDFLVNFSAAAWYSEPDGAYTRAAMAVEGPEGGPAVVSYEFSLAVFDEVDMTADFLSRRRLLAADDVIGFNLEFADYDEHSELLDAKWSLSGGHNAYRLADRFTDLRLAPVVPTLVRSSTWGRIKSTFAAPESLY
ncbi:MAG: hypothetical protein OXG13_02555 [Gemmatimonadaceae bacterium]|nr:hypothetical protein [Gemmatimonadaceae bacterium]